jgi:hypothetical protein
MYARLVNLVLKNVDDRTELTGKIERDILPILRKQDGFHDEITLSTPDRPEVTAISFWNDREHAEEYLGRLRHPAQNLTNTPGLDDVPSWSPDGRRIAFVTSRVGDREIYVMNADGSEPINISNTPLIDGFSPAWRPEARFKGT